MEQHARPNRHSNPSTQAKNNRKPHKGKFMFIHKKRQETRELLKAVA